MIQSADILEWAKANWANVVLILTDPNNCPTPGGIHLGRVPETENGDPYVSMKVTEGKPEWNASANYTQLFTLELRLWSSKQAAPVGEYQRWVDANFDVRIRQSIALSNGQFLNILSSLRQPGELSQDDSRKEAKDVLIGSCRYELYLQGVR